MRIDSTPKKFEETATAGDNACGGFPEQYAAAGAAAPKKELAEVAAEGPATKIPERADGMERASASGAVVFGTGLALCMD